MVYKLVRCESKDFKGKNRWKQMARTFLFFGATHCDMPRFRRACPAPAWAKVEVLFIRHTDIQLSKSNAAGFDYPT
jgi:hypothetical protein